MHCYIAKMGQQAISGSWYQCRSWGIEQIKADVSVVVKILLIRAGEKQARIIAEITSDGVRSIPNGRYLALRKLAGVAYGKE